MRILRSILSVLRPTRNIAVIAVLIGLLVGWGSWLWWPWTPRQTLDESRFVRFPLRNKLNVALAFSPDGQQAAGFSEERKVIVLDLATGQTQRTYRLPQNWSQVIGLIYSPHGNLLAAGFDNEELFLWDL